jgi:TusA-related sulfurtransferase
MRTKHFLWVLAGVVAAAMIAAPAAWAGGKGCCPGHAKGSQGMAWMAQATVAVVNLADGVQVTATAESPEAVKAIQDHFAKMAGECPGHAGMAWRKDAKFVVANLADGAVLTVTSTNADAVQAIQEHFAAMGENCRKGAAMGENCCKGAAMGANCCKGAAMAWKKDAKFVVENLSNGAAVTVTSDNPETVKAIQEHLARMAGTGETPKGCAHGHGKKGK